MRVSLSGTRAAGARDRPGRAPGAVAGQYSARSRRDRTIIMFSVPAPASISSAPRISAHVTQAGCTLAALAVAAVPAVGATEAALSTAGEVSVIGALVAG